MKYLQDRRDKFFPLLAGKWHTEEFHELILPKLKTTKVNDMSYTMWFFFHPTAYKLMYYFAPIVFIICMLPAFILGLINKNWWLVFIFGFFISIVVRSLFEKIINKKLYPTGYTFYDNLIKKEEDYFK
jgi:hypothetical protein